MGAGVTSERSQTRRWLLALLCFSGALALTPTAHAEGLPPNASAPPKPETRTDAPGNEADAASTPPDATAAAVDSVPQVVQVRGEARADLGAIRIPRADARKVPGAFADPFRVVEILPGVAPVLSGLPYFFVRGAPPGSVGYFIDGIRVPLLFHVGAGPSVIAPALVDRVELVPAAYPVRFGRYVGGVVSGETTKPSERGRAEAEARVFDSGVMVEQPFANGRASALLAGRYSYTQALLSLVAPDYELGYWDYQARLSFAPAPRDRVALFGFGAHDHLGNLKKQKTLFDVDFHRLDLGWDHAFDFGGLRLSLIGGTDQLLNTDEDGNGQVARSVRQTLALRFDARIELSETAELRSGFELDLDHHGSEIERFGNVASGLAPRTDRGAALFAEVSLRPRRGFEIVPGVRLDLRKSRGANYVFPEPRLSSRMRVATRVAWLSNFGVSHQLPAERVFVPGGTPGPLEWGMQRAYQASQAIEVALPASMYTRVGFFHNYVHGDVASANSRAYGLECFVRRDFSEKLGVFLAYTLSRIDLNRGPVAIQSSFDRPHVFSGVLGYDLGSGFRFGTRAYYASGRRYFAACPTADCAPADPAAPRTHFFNGRLDGFFRLDLRFEKRFPLEGGAWWATTFEWFNALMAGEAGEREWSPSRGGLHDDTRSPLTLPSIGIEGGY